MFLVSTTRMTVPIIEVFQVQSILYSVILTLTMIIHPTSIEKWKAEHNLRSRLSCFALEAEWGYMRPLKLFALPGTANLNLVHWGNSQASNNRLPFTWAAPISRSCSRRPQHSIRENQLYLYLAVLDIVFMGYTCIPGNPILWNSLLNMHQEWYGPIRNTPFFVLAVAVLLNHIAWEENSDI